jgi:type II secretory pathway component GspD/PulD (secretin)
MREITIPQVEFKRIPIRQALAALQQAAAENDPKKRALNIVLQLTPEQEEAAKATPVTWSARGKTVLEALQRTTELAGLAYSIQGTIVHVLPPDTPVANLVTRRYPVVSARNEMEVTNSPVEQTVAQPWGWQTLLSEFGVTWPCGSSVKHLPGIESLVIRNTVENHRRLRMVLEVMDSEPRQVQVDLQFVAYDLTNIARVAAAGITLNSLMALWTNGCGQLLAAPTVVTGIGREAVVKGVTEIIYPTGYESDWQQATNTPETFTACQSLANNLPVPGLFDMRETGSFLQIVPEIGADGQVFNLSFNPQLVEQPVWHMYGDEVPAGKAQTAPTQQPYFHVYSTATQVSTYSGRRILLGGGMPSRDGKRLVYVFATATLVDTSGQPLPVRDVADVWNDTPEP